METIMNKRFIVAVVGEAASGKSMASRWLESALGFTRVGVS